MISDWIIDIKSENFMYRQHCDMNFVYRRCCLIKKSDDKFIGKINLKTPILYSSDNLEDVVSNIDKKLIDIGFEIKEKKVSGVYKDIFNKEDIFKQINIKLKG